MCVEVMVPYAFFTCQAWALGEQRPSLGDTHNTETLMVESPNELGLCRRKDASATTGTGIRSRVCQPRPPWELPPPYPQEHWAGFGFVHFTHPTVGTTRDTALKEGPQPLLAAPQRGGTRHSRGFGDFGTIADFWISAHYHKWAMWMSVTDMQAVMDKWWVPTPLPMTWASLSCLLGGAFSLTGPDLPKSRVGEGKDRAPQGICLPQH